MSMSANNEELPELRRRLQEAEETLRAIRCGEVDALVVENAGGEQIYTLQGADHPYRVLIEAMQQGAASLSDDGTVLYCNQRFAEMLKIAHEKVIGASVTHFMGPLQRAAFEVMMSQRHSENSQGELLFKTGDGSLLPVYIALAPLPLSEANTFCMVVTDLTQQKQHKELQDASRRKDEFLAMLAHELRNPLAPIQNAAAILRHIGVEDERVRYSTEIIERQVYHMTHLVDDLLDVSRITLGKVKLQKEAVEVATILERAVDSSRPIIESRRQQLTLVLPPKGVRVEADPTRLTQVVSNLLTNAAKYTDESGEIWLTTEREGSEVLIRVRDNGMGISTELLPHVFELFTQGDRSLARSEGGLGIGLTLVQRLVELHNGSVIARSEGPGKGSEFVVRLPLLREEIQPSNVDTHQEFETKGSKSLNILVVEDNKDGADSLGLLLRMMGHQVRISYSGTEAIPVATSLRPHIVLLDIGLPGMNGYEVAKQLRQLPEFGTTTLVAMTGYGQDEDRQKTYAAGFDHHLVKPVAPIVLKELLEMMERTNH